MQQQKETKIPLVRGYFLSYYWNTTVSIRMKKNLSKTDPCRMDSPVIMAFAEMRTSIFLEDSLFNWKQIIESLFL